MEEQQNPITKLKEDYDSHMPTKNAWCRACISLIPHIGGALDHLIFDKAETIKLENIEKSINEIKQVLNILSETQINKSWFETKEALHLFSELIENIKFEHNEEKISTLSKVFISSGMNEHLNDPEKFIVLNKISQMTNVQRKILYITSNITSEIREFKNTSGMNSKITAIWIDQIKKHLEDNYEDNRFWSGILDLNLELDIIESLNLIRRKINIVSNEYGYILTALGKRVIDYLTTIKHLSK